MPVDRLRPRYSLRSLTCLPRYRAQQLPLPPREARRRQVRRAARLRGAGVRRFQGPVRVPAGQGRARDGCLGEGDSRDHARGRVGRPCSRTAALQLVRGRGRVPRRTTSSTGISPPNDPTRSGSRTPRGIKAGDGKLYLSPMIDCYDGMVVARTAGMSPNVEPARHDAGSGPPPRCGPASVPWSTVTAVVITGGRDGWNGWAGTAWSGP